MCNYNVCVCTCMHAMWVHDSLHTHTGLYIGLSKLAGFNNWKEVYYFNNTTNNQQHNSLAFQCRAREEKFGTLAQQSGKLLVQKLAWTSTNLASFKYGSVW